jgi:hypothetical protein
VEGFLVLAVVLQRRLALVEADVEVVVKSLPAEEYHGTAQPIRFLNRSMLAIGARDTSTSVVSQACRWDGWPMPLARSEQVGQPWSSPGKPDSACRYMKW